MVLANPTHSQLLLLEICRASSVAAAAPTHPLCLLPYMSCFLRTKVKNVHMKLVVTTITADPTKACLYHHNSRSNESMFVPP